MQIFQRLFGDHSVNLERAMDRTSQRMGLLTHNLANVNTPGYKRKDVDLGVPLQEEGVRIGDRIAVLKENSNYSRGITPVDLRTNGVGLDDRIIGRQRFSITTQSGDVQESKGSVRVDGSSVDLEKEVMSVSETQLRYEMLTEMTSRYFRGIKNVIREGR